ncbi:MAG TPA: DUF86 domain-containing protein [Steroidobacteraceae bacterium]|nr:DUF86 domain-containing protein [Steroidobacteraceae bacterium]
MNERNAVAARKIATIVRSIERARFEYTQAEGRFKEDFTRQDAAVLNVTRACEAAIDLANMVIRQRRLGVTADARESFSLLERNHLLPSDLSGHLQRMIGFRNIAVHQYQDLDIQIVESVIRNQLDELLKFAEIARSHLQSN